MHNQYNIIWQYLISVKIYVPWKILEHGLGLVLASFFLARRRSIVGCIFGTALARCSVVIYIRAGGIKRAGAVAIAPLDLEDLDTKHVPSSDTVKSRGQRGNCTPRFWPHLDAKSVPSIDHWITTF